MAKKINGNDIFQALYKDLICGRLKPGDSLREVALAERFGVSRTPVREALRKLESRGLLNHQPHLGMVVPTLSNQQVTELYEFREILECAAAGLAARHASDLEIEDLQQMVEQDQQHLDNPEYLAASNKSFHNALRESAKNHYLIDALNSLAESLSLLGSTSIAVEGRAESSVKEHAEIVAALMSRDAEKAQQAARKHVREAHRARRALRDRY